MRLFLGIVIPFDQAFSFVSCCLRDFYPLFYPLFKPFRSACKEGSAVFSCQRDTGTRFKRGNHKCGLEENIGVGIDHVPLLTFFECEVQIAKTFEKRE